MRQKLLFSAVFILFCVLVYARWEGSRLRRPKPDLGAFPVTLEPADIKPEVYGYLSIGSLASLNSMRANISSVDAVMVSGMHLEKEKIHTDDTANFKDRFDFIAAQNKKAYILADNDSETAFTDITARERIISDMAAFAKKWKLAGISLDFENVSGRSQADYARFCGELKKTLNKNGLELSVHVPAGDPAWNYRELSKNADKIILMDYDQHSWRTGAGPIASLDWFEKSIQTMRDEGVPSGKIIVGMGSYAYDWPAAGNALGISYGMAKNLAAKNKAEIKTDLESQNEYFNYKDSAGKGHQVWLSGAQSVKAQKEAALKHSPAGLALFRFGSEDPNVWKELK